MARASQVPARRQVAEELIRGRILKVCLLKGEYAYSLHVVEDSVRKRILNEQNTWIENTNLRTISRDAFQLEFCVKRPHFISGKFSGSQETPLAIAQIVP
jgi:hypothetical protein